MKPHKQPSFFQKNIAQFKDLLLNWGVLRPYVEKKYTAASGHVFEVLDFSHDLSNAWEIHPLYHPEVSDHLDTYAISIKSPLSHTHNTPTLKDKKNKESDVNIEAMISMFSQPLRTRKLHSSFKDTVEKMMGVYQNTSKNLTHQSSSSHCFGDYGLEVVSSRPICRTEDAGHECQRLLVTSAYLIAVKNSDNQHEKTHYFVGPFEYDQSTFYSFLARSSKLNPLREAFGVYEEKNELDLNLSVGVAKKSIHKL